jgi:hypothetical protein
MESNGDEFKNAPQILQRIMMKILDKEIGNSVNIP